MKLLAAIFLIAASAAASIHGVVTNGTTNKPQAGVSVTLLKLDQGMVEIGRTVSDANGHFEIEAPPPAADIPYLVRGTYQDVAYHSAARDATVDVHVNVFEKTLDHNAAKLVTQQLIVEPRTGTLLVSEVYTVRNDSNPPKTLAGPVSGADKDTFHFTAAKGAIHDLTIGVSGPSQMPLKQVANEHDGGVYGLEFPFRPGETKIEVAYKLPYEGTFQFTEPSVKTLVGGPTEVTVIAPIDVVKITGANIAPLSDDKAQGASFYSWKSAKPLDFSIAGILDTPPPGAAAAGGPASNQVGGPPVAGAAPQDDIATMENQNFVFQIRWKILIVLGAALLLGLGYLYKMSPSPTQPSK